MTEKTSVKPSNSQASGSTGCSCQRCGESYTVDLIVDDALWEKIKPKGKAVGAGLLCGSCIMTLIEYYSGFDVYHLQSND